MRSFKITRSSMEWTRIRRDLMRAAEHGVNLSAESEALVNDIEDMTRYDDQHAFPERPRVALPDRVESEATDTTRYKGYTAEQVFAAVFLFAYYGGFGKWPRTPEFMFAKERVWMLSQTFRPPRTEPLETTTAEYATRILKGVK